MAHGTVVDFPDAEGRRLWRWLRALLTRKMRAVAGIANIEGAVDGVAAAARGAMDVVDAAGATGAEDAANASKWRRSTFVCRLEGGRILPEIGD